MEASHKCLAHGRCSTEVYTAFPWLKEGMNKEIYKAIQGYYKYKSSYISLFSVFFKSPVLKKHSPFTTLDQCL